jgi:hypothetical protein
VKGEVFPLVSDMVDEWLALRHTLSQYRRDICFICEKNPRQISIQGLPVGVCRNCDADSSNT